MNPISWIKGLFQPALHQIPHRDPNDEPSLTPMLQQAAADGLVERWEDKEDGSTTIYFDDPELERRPRLMCGTPILQHAVSQGQTPKVERTSDNVLVVHLQDRKEG